MSFFNSNDKKTSQNPALCAQNIKSCLKNDVTIHCFDTIDSTNTQAKKNLSLLCDTPVLFVANHQTKGKGRLSRSFYSPADTGLYMSLLIKTDTSTDDTVCMTTATAVCVAKALKDLCNVSPKIKWVNDIYIKDKKVCGILCEAVTNPVTLVIEGIVIGIGVNISTTDFPHELKDIATSIGCCVDRNRLCAKITDNIIDMYSHIAQRSFIEEYKKFSLVLNKEITYIENNETKTAKAIDIDNNGGLIIQTENGVKTLCTGEITVRLK